MKQGTQFNQVQDTALWAAAARAVESSRPDALFRDMFAQRFAGQDLPALAAFCRRAGGTWPVVARTVLIDQWLQDAIHGGADAVINLAAGYDARPYRLSLPRSLVWLEVDHGDVLANKRRVLDGAQSACQVEPHALDLADVSARGRFFAEVSARFRRPALLTEGLLYYLTEQSALGLAEALLELRPSIWLFDMHNAAANELVRRRTAGALRGTAAMRFGPDQGPAVFERFGWEVRRVSSTVKTAGRLGRLPWWLSLLSRLPEPRYGTPRRPWGGVCALVPRTSHAST